MDPAKCASPTSIQPREHSHGGMQADPCLTTGTFPELTPWALDTEKKRKTIETFSELNPWAVNTEKKSKSKPDFDLSWCQCSSLQLSSLMPLQAN